MRNGKFRRIDSTFDVGAPFYEVDRILQSKAAHKMIEVTTEFLNLEADNQIRCDKRRLMQVILNLLGNALKFTPKSGQIKIKVKILNRQNRLEQEPYPELRAFCGNDDMLEISVCDTGTGIKEKDMAKLFQLYGFIKETQEINTSGIGLGLHICRKIIN